MLLLSLFAVSEGRWKRLVVAHSYQGDCNYTQGGGETGRFLPTMRVVWLVVDLGRELRNSPLVR